MVFPQSETSRNLSITYIVVSGEEISSSNNLITLFPCQITKPMRKNQSLDLQFMRKVVEVHGRYIFF